MPVKSPPTRSADEALKLVKSGQHVLVGSGCAEPELLVDALVRRAPELYDVEVLHLLTAGRAPYADPRYEGRFRHNAFFIGPNVRSAVGRGHADYTPCFLSELPSYIRSGRIPIDAVLVQTSPPDASGQVSLGISVDILLAGIEAAKTVIAQVNPRMPRTRGGSSLPLQRFDALVPGEAPLQELRFEPPGGIAREIGAHVARLVEDGATLQMGIGAIPDGILLHLDGKKDLGVHTEMFSDGLLRLIEKGVVNGRRKTLHPGKIICSFCLGTRRAYDFVDDNPLFEFLPSDYVNDPWVIAKNARMTSINSALQVDLTGQVCSDSIGPRLYSGFGGQVDFIRGAARSDGGKAIIALPSTAKDGAVSRIVATLDPGAGVVTTRADVDFVVTEYGIAHLKGRSVRERALALIQAAHPRFRKELFEAAKRLTYLYPDQPPLPEAGLPYPGELEAWFTAKDGSRLLIRPLKASDERYLRDLFYAQSERTVYMRYGVPLKRLARPQIQEIVQQDYDRRLALGAFEGRGRTVRLVGVVEYVLDPATRLAEMAILVDDRWQDRGLGSQLLGRLARTARSRGLRGFTARVLAENARMMTLLRGLGGRLQSRLEDGAYAVTVLF